MKNSIVAFSIILSGFLGVSCNDQSENSSETSSSRSVNNKTSEKNEETASADIAVESKKSSGQDLEMVYDMAENSFCIGMPAGWQNLAVIHRIYSSPRTLITATAPDKDAVIFMGDPGLPIYALPNPQMEQMYNQYGIKSPYTFMNFVSAEEFFSSYIQQRFGHLEGFTIDEKFINQNILDLQAMELKKVSFTPQVSNMSFRFHYLSDGHTIHGVINGCTIAVGSIWLPEVSGFCTTGDPDKMETLMTAMAKSRVTNPAWQRQQDAMIEENSRRMTMQHQQNMANIQASSQAHQQRMAALQQSHDAWNNSWSNNEAAIDNGHKKFINSINNEHTVMDKSGNTYQVDNYQSRYFVDKTNNVYIGAHGTVTLDDLRQIKGLNIDNFSETQIIR